MIRDPTKWGAIWPIMTQGIMGPITDPYKNIIHET